MAYLGLARESCVASHLVTISGRAAAIMVVVWCVLAATAAGELHSYRVGVNLVPEEHVVKQSWRRALPG